VWEEAAEADVLWRVDVPGLIKQFSYLAPQPAVEQGVIPS
jgi:hypothetical protein